MTYYHVQPCPLEMAGWRSPIPWVNRWMELSRESSSVQPNLRKLFQRCRSWLRHCATSRKVAGSIPDGVIGIFHWHSPSGRTMALGLTQPLTEMSTRNISYEVKASGVYRWQPNHLHVPTVLKSGSLNLLEPSGPVQSCNGTALPSQHDPWMRLVIFWIHFSDLLSLVTYTLYPIKTRGVLRYTVGISPSCRGAGPRTSNTPTSNDSAQRRTKVQRPWERTRIHPSPVTICCSTIRSRHGS